MTRLYSLVDTNCEIEVVLVLVLSSKREEIYVLKGSVIMKLV